MRLHIVSLPWTHTTPDWTTCAYTQKVVKAGKMFMDAGHDVLIYSGEFNETPCTEHISLLSESERAGWFGQRDLNDINFGGISWDRTHPSWVTMNARAATEILARMESNHDLVLLIGGNCQQEIADNVKPLTSCEFGVGYEGVFTNFCAFESHAWRHHVYGLMGEKNGRWYDTVIPNYFDPTDFDTPDMSGGYLLFIGRVTQRKGPHVAAQIANEMGMKLMVAGGGVSAVEHLPGGGDRIYGDHITFEGPGVEYVGAVGPKTRAELMAGAVACLVPTLYVEPFGGVAVEAMMTGTPVVAPDYGAFTETVIPGLSGYWFTTLADGCDAVDAASSLDREKIKEYARGRYSLEAVAPMFTSWFERLDGLWEEGWNAPWQ